MTSKIIELKPNRQLIDPEFVGYKLSLDNTPILKKEFHVPVKRIHPDPNNYSYLHAKLIGLHNYLIGEDIGELSVVYFINEDGVIQKITLNSSECGIHIVNVFNIPKHRNKSHLDYNASLKFMSDSLAILSDGMGKLYILQTSDRNRQENCWKSLFCEIILEEGKSFIIQDARLQQCTDKVQIHCLVYSIQKKKCDERFVSILNWVILTETESGTWKITQIKKITSDSNNEISYAYIETSCEALYLISDGCFQFENDSPDTEAMQLNEVLKNQYTWNQTLENVTCQLQIPDNTNMDSINVSTGATNISITINGKSILKGELYDKIDNHLTNWSIDDDDNLVVTMSKQDDGKLWSSLIIKDDTALTGEPKIKLNHLQMEKQFASPLGTTFNSEQVEECDFEDDKYTTFERISSVNYEVTHKINMNMYTLVLTVKTNENRVPAVALRHDVDAIIWQPELDEDGNFSFTHQGTLNALGYVQASKTHRKFSVSGSDFNYCAICNTSRHVFIYKQRVASSGDLRNRSTGKKIQHTAQQQVIDLGNDDEILGIYAAKNKLFLLTLTQIYVLKL